MIGCDGQNKSENAGREETVDDNSENLNVEQAEPVASLSAAELKAAYFDNSIKADISYEGKVIAINGSVTSIGKDEENRLYADLSAHQPGPPTARSTTVRCYFDTSYEAYVADLERGETINIKGLCLGEYGNSNYGDVIVYGCIPIGCMP